jgi:hypothetical protein
VKVNGAKRSIETNRKGRVGVSFTSVLILSVAKSSVQI